MSGFRYMKSVLLLKESLPFLSLRWVHFDPCEAIADEPLLYEAGWGKKLTYLVAFHRFGVADVTRRYTRDWQGLIKRRTLIGEDQLDACLKLVTNGKRLNLDTSTLIDLKSMDEEELAELELSCPSSKANLPARQSGSKEWIASRGEDGEGSSQ